MKDVEIDIDPLFAGATRPAMLFGVTYEFCVVNGLLVTLIFLSSGNPLYMLLVLPIHAFGYMVSLKEPRIFTLFFTWAVTMSKCRNRRFWGKSTYTPL